MNPEINAEVERWWFDLCDDNVGPEARELAKHNMESLCVALTEVGQGRITTISPEEREQIIAAYQKWRPICEELNKSFKEWWQDPKYCSSELHRKEIRGTLAENLSILVEDVEAIEWSLKKRSPKGGKSTPSQATCHRVAREFPGRGEKTIEEVWGDYVRNHPEESRKRRKISTTPVAERTV